MIDSSILVHELSESKVYQKDLAKTLGTSQSTISKKLNGQMQWSLEDALILANTLDKPVEILFRRE